MLSKISDNNESRNLHPQLDIDDYISPLSSKFHCLLVCYLVQGILVCFLVYPRQLGL